MVSEDPSVEGLVVAGNDRGFQLQGAEKWYNWSKYAFEPRTLPAPGHWIRATLDGQGFVRTVEIVQKGNSRTGKEAKPETRQPVAQRDTTNGGTAPRSGVFVPSQPAMQADRQFRLDCLTLVLSYPDAFSEAFDSEAGVLQLAEAVLAWAEGREA